MFGTIVLDMFKNALALLAGIPEQLAFSAILNVPVKNGSRLCPRL